MEAEELRDAFIQEIGLQLKEDRFQFSSQCLCLDPLASFIVNVLLEDGKELTKASSEFVIQEMVGKLDHEPAVHAEEVEEDCVYGEEEINVDEEESVPGEEESNVGEGDSVHSEEEEEAEEVIFETFGVSTTADNDISATTTLIIPLY